MRVTNPLLAGSMSVAEHARDFLRRNLCAAYGDEFFLYEKMGRRAIVSAESNSEAGTEIPHPITPKRRESKGNPFPLAELEAEPRGLSLPNTQSLRRSIHQKIQIGLDKSVLVEYTVNIRYIQLRGEGVELIISNASGKPIYEQISDQIKNRILCGELKEGDALPSLRLLAKELRISVITTKRAYEDLERDGFIETVAGKGCFVARKNLDFLREEHLRQLEAALLEAVGIARRAGISLEEAGELLRLLYEEE